MSDSIVNLSPANELPLFFNIAPYAPGRETELAAEMREYQERTGNSLVLYSLTLHPQGRPAMRKVEFALASYRKLKQALAGSGVRLGILLQSLLGHWPRVDKDEEPWTRSVNIDGEKVRFCPLDKDFSDYIRTVGMLLAREAPAFILSDDDVRAFSPKAECFCPLHTAEFNRRMNWNCTPDEFRAAVRDSRPGDRVFTVFGALQREMVDGVAQLLREGIDSVDPAIPSGTCMPGCEYRFNGDTACSIAGTHPPVMRLCNADYFESSAKNFPSVMIRTQALHEAWPAIPHMLDEADTFPHNLYSRSAVGMHAKLCGAFFCGLSGAKFWLVNASKYGHPVSRKYTDILAQYSGFYRTLLRETRATAADGIIQPCHKAFPEWHPAHNIEEFFIEPKSWGETLFGAYGIAFRCSFDLAEKGVYALAGSQSVRRFADEDLRKLLSGKILIDGDAALELTGRGFAPLTGVSAEKNAFRFTGERHVQSDDKYPLFYSPDTPFLAVLAPETQIVTELYYESYADSGKKEYSAPGSVIYRNALGGTVCTTAFRTNDFLSLYHEMRKAWLKELLERLDRKATQWMVGEEQNFTVLARRYEDGRALLAIFNLNFEPAERISLYCAGEVCSVEQLTPTGEWLPLNYTESRGRVTLPVVLHCYENTVLRIGADDGSTSGEN